MGVTNKDNQKINELVSLIQQLVLQIERVSDSDPERAKNLLSKLDDCIDCLDGFEVFRGCMSIRMLRDNMNEVRDRLNDG